MNKLLPRNKILTKDILANDDEQIFLHDLDSGLKATAELLKHKHGHWFGKSHLYKESWTLVIGPKNAGKTSLLQNSEKKLAQNQTTHSQTSGTWVFDNAVYIEVPGQFITDKHSLPQWPAIIKTIKNVRKRKPLDSITLVLNLYDFVQQSHQARKSLCHNFIRAIKDIAQHTKTALPLYVVLTHADCIAGFTDFFAEMTQPQRENILGIIMPEDTKKSAVQRSFDKAFTLLLQRLNELLIPTLHRTKNAEKRSRIKEFPLQIESMRGLFSYILQHIIKLNERTLQCKFKGIFFTSSAQQGTSFDCLALPIENHYALELVSHTQQEQQMKPYFIQELVHSLIPAEGKNISKLNAAEKKKQLTVYGSIYATASIAAISCIFFLFQHFKQTANTIQQINSDLQSFQRLQQSSNQTNSDSVQLISSIHLLTNLKEDASKVNNSWPISFPYPYLKNLKNQIEQLFSSSIQNQFLPNLAAEIEHSLENVEIENPADLYQTLKAYIMLGNPNRMEVSYFIQWIEQYWQGNSNLKPKILERNIATLRQILKKPLQPLSVNMQVIKEAREKLNEFPKARLAYLILKDQEKISLSQDNTANDDGSTKDDNITPSIFTIEGFQTTYQTKIPEISQELITGNWVLGKPIDTNDEENKPEKLISQVQELYVDDYIHWWQQALNNSSLKPFKSLADAIQSLAEFRHQYFSSNDWLKDINHNTALLPNKHPLSKLFNSRIASQFISLQNLKNTHFANVQQNIRNLETQLEKMALAKNTDKAAFLFTKQRFSQEKNNDALSAIYETAEQFPDPIRSWLTSIANQSWTLLIKKSGDYINDQWQLLIWPNYENNITNRFPLEKEAEQEIDIKQFTQFFSPQGALSQFFTNFIKPFLETTQSNWTTKQVNGLTLNLSADVIQNFERANIIRLMFFGKESATPRAKFYLKPLGINDKVSHLVLNINDQKVFDYFGSNKTSQFTWDSHAANPSSSLEFQDNEGKTWRVAEAGVWGWLKLLDKFSLQSNDDTRQYVLSFKIDGKEAAKYILLADNMINPLIPGVLDNFKLAEEVCG